MLLSGMVSDNLVPDAPDVNDIIIITEASNLNIEMI